MNKQPCQNTEHFSGIAGPGLTLDRQPVVDIRYDINLREFYLIMCTSCKFEKES